VLGGATALAYDPMAVAVTVAVVTSLEFPLSAGRITATR